jgi:hypothetical protein
MPLPLYTILLVLLRDSWLITLASGAASQSTDYLHSGRSDIGLFLRLPWLPYVIGFMVTVIVSLVFLFFYLHIRSKRQEIADDEEKSFISSRRSSGKDISSMLGMIGPSHMQHSASHGTMTSNALASQSPQIVSTNQLMMNALPTLEPYNGTEAVTYHNSKSANPIAIPKRNRANTGTKSFLAVGSHTPKDRFSRSHGHQFDINAANHSVDGMFDHQSSLNVQRSHMYHHLHKHHYLPPSHHPIMQSASGNIISSRHEGHIDNIEEEKVSMDHP